MKRVFDRYNPVIWNYFKESGIKPGKCLGKGFFSKVYALDGHTDRVIKFTTDVVHYRWMTSGKKLGKLAPVLIEDLGQIGTQQIGKSGGTPVPVYAFIMERLYSSSDVKVKQIAQPEYQILKYVSNRLYGYGISKQYFLSFIANLFKQVLDLKQRSEPVENLAFEIPHVITAVKKAVKPAVWSDMVEKGINNATPLWNSGKLLKFKDIPAQLSYDSLVSDEERTESHQRRFQCYSAYKWQKLISYVYNQDIAVLKSLTKFFKGLASILKDSISKFEPILDFHGGNYMFRASGEFVILDPVCSKVLLFRFRNQL